MAATNTHELDSTISALEGGLTALTPSAAVSNITTWQHKLASAGKPELEAIAKELDHLKELLGGSKLDGKAIGHSLTTLGQHTTASAKDAADGISDKLTQLGKILSKAGKSLS